MIEILTDPIFLLAASMGIFLFLVWAALPFALYGIRRRIDRNGQRLDRISETLERALEVLMVIQEQGEGPESGPSSGAGEAAGVAGPSERLLSELRGEMAQFAPVMRERVEDAENIIFDVSDPEGADMPCLILTLQDFGVQVSVPLLSLARSFPEFSPEQFSQYATSFLPEKHGYFSTTSPDGGEFQVNIEPREDNTLELFMGIIREQLFEPIGGDG